MKIKLLSELFNSTLSCILKCLRFFPMIHRKLILALFILSSLSACTAPTAMLGPAYTLSTTGNVSRLYLSMISAHSSWSVSADTEITLGNITVDIDSSLSAVTS